MSLYNKELKRYKNVSSGEMPVLTKDFGESNTDKKYFRPDISKARATLGAMASGSNRVGVYDFPDGKDTGMTLQTALRNQGFDRTEFDYAYEVLKSSIEQKKRETLENVGNEKERKKQEKLYDSLLSIADEARASHDKNSQKPDA